jgi:hypothetical protein
MNNKSKNAGKGMTPRIGYNSKKWYSNYDQINWRNKWCAMCGKYTDHTSGMCPELKDLTDNPSFTVK